MQKLILKKLVILMVSVGHLFTHRTEMMKMFKTNTEKLHNEQSRIAAEKKSNILLMSSEKISDMRVELILGIISDENKEKLTRWMLFIREVNAINTDLPNDIIWPEAPED